MIYAFAEHELDTRLYELRRAGERRPLQPQVFDLLTYLVEHRDRVVSKQECLDHVWAGRIVCESTLTHSLMQARKAVRDCARKQALIQTVHGRGYRFVGTVTERDVDAPGRSGPDRVSAHRAATTEPSLDPNVRSGETPERRPDCGRPVEGACKRIARASKELKQVSVLRCGLTNASALARRLDLEAMDRLTETFFAISRSAMQRYGGTVTQWLDCGFLALFGAPLAHEDHGRRAVLAGLKIAQEVEIKRACEPSMCDLIVQTGVHTGPVLVGNLQNEQGGVYAVMCETTEIATGLHDVAPPGVLLVSDSTHALVHTEIHAEPHDKIAAREGADKQRIYAIKAVVKRSAGVRHCKAPKLSRFVGRDRELAILHEHLESVSCGQGQVVGVTGEPGIGKSRLLHEFKNSLAGSPVTCLEGQCLSYRSATPYGPVLGVVRQMCGIYDGDRSQTIRNKIAR
ncbi:MAG: AAA family ATPase, partial [Gammaproteobacteria bacterium]